jgi:predicted nucleic acid-binding protein
MMDTVIELIKLGSVGIISGLFSAYIAIRGHRDKKWWELRVEAYKSLIEALSDLTYYYQKKYTAECYHEKLSKEYEEGLSKFWDESYHKVRKAADSGVFLFSNEVNQELKKFMALENQRDDTYFDYVDSYSAVTEQCLKAVVSSAKKDLKVKDAWL